MGYNIKQRKVKFFRYRIINPGGHLVSSVLIDVQKIYGFSLPPGFGVHFFGVGYKRPDVFSLGIPDKKHVAADSRCYGIQIPF